MQFVICIRASLLFVIEVFALRRYGLYLDCMQLDSPMPFSDSRADSAIGNALRQGRLKFPTQNISNVDILY